MVFWCSNEIITANIGPSLECWNNASIYIKIQFSEVVSIPDSLDIADYSNLCVLYMFHVTLISLTSCNLYYS